MCGITITTMTLSTLALPSNSGIPNIFSRTEQKYHLDMSNKFTPFSPCSAARWKTLLNGATEQDRALEGPTLCPEQQLGWNNSLECGKTCVL